MFRRMTILAAVLLGSATVAAAAQTYPEERVARLDVQPNAVTVRVGERVPIRIVPVDEDGRRVDDVVIGFFARGAGAWYDERTSQILGLVPGDELLMARIRRAAAAGPGFSDVWGFVRITVLPGAIDRLELEDAGDTPLVVGTHVALGARAFSGDLARDDAEITWSTSNADVADVTVRGLVRANRAGRAQLTARAGSATARLDVRVIENPVASLVIEAPTRGARVGDVVRMTADARDRRGQPVTPIRVEWALLPASGQGADAAYLAQDGAFVAYAPGVHRVQARVGAVTAIAEISASPRPPRRAVRRIAHGVVPTGQATTDLWVFAGQDGRDYVYTGTYSGNLMYAWDVTDPAHPVITDSVSFDGRRVNDVKINADASVAIVTSENASNRRNGLTVLDIRSPAHPQRVAHFTDGLTGGVHNTWIEGDLVYAVHYGTQDLHIIDITNPRAPRRVGRWGLEKDNKWLHDVMIVDGLAYLSYWDDGLIILDVGAGMAGGSPTAPRFVSQYKYQYQLSNDGQTYGNTHHAIRYGDYVFVGDEIFGCGECVNGPRGYIHVVDVSDIRTPREVASYRVPEAGSHNMWAEDDKLYIGYYQAGLRVVDISGELRGDLYRQGREIGWFMTEDAQGTQPFATNTWGAQPYKGKIYASDGASGLWIVEMAQPPAVVP